MRSSHRLVKGLYYFPLKTNILNNEKIKILRADNGNEGFAVLLFLLTRLYGNDEEYYKKFGNREKKLFCEDEKVEKVKLEEVLETCFSEDIFSSRMYQKYEIITSENIQLTWAQITKRREKVTMIKEYMLISESKMPYPDKVEIINLKNGIEKEVIIEPKKRPVSPKKYVTAPEEEQSTYLISGDLMPGTGQFLTDEVKTFCAQVYDDQNEKFKKQVDKKLFSSYKKLNDLIDKDYLPLRSSNKQMTYPDFVKLTTTPINGIIPDNFEINAALKKLTGTGVNLTTSIYHKLIEYVGYVREPKNINGKNGSNNTPAKTGNKIDHSEAAKNF